MSALRAAFRRGYNRLDQILADPTYARLREDPGFRALIDDIAAENLRRLAQNESPSQLDFQAMAVAHFARGDLTAAIDALQSALSQGGPSDERIRKELEALRREREGGRRTIQSGARWQYRSHLHDRHPKPPRARQYRGHQNGR